MQPTRLREPREAPETPDQRLAFLAEASQSLSDSLDGREIVARLLRFVVPALADYCVLDLFDEAGEIRRAAAVHADPGCAPLMSELKRHPPSVGDHTGLGELLRTGRPTLVPDVTDEMLRAAISDPEHLRALLALHPRSSLLVPLLSRGRILGGLALSRVGEDRRYGPADLSLAEELGYRAALAIDNARLFQEAQQAAHRHEESRALLDTLLISAPVGISFLDQDLRYLRINNVMAALNGIQNPEDVVGRSIHEVLPDLAKRIEGYCCQVLETGQPVVELDISGETPAAPGVRRHFLANYYPIRTPEGRIFGVGSAVIEITERKRAEEKLREANQTLQALIQACPLAVLVLDPPDGVVRLWNPAAERIFGWTEKEVLGRPAPVLPPERAEEVRSNIEKIFRGEFRQGTESLRLAKSGEEVDVALWAAPLRDSQGSLHVLSLVADITEQKHLREELRRRIDELAAADRSKDEFLAMLAHELRNPLAAIANAGHLLAQPGDDRRNAEVSGIIRRQVRHLTRLVDDLLDVSRFTRGTIELRKVPVELRGLVEGAVETVRPLLESRRHTLEVSIADEPLWLEADPTRLDQVLANLLNNAAKFTEPGGTVRLTAAREGEEAVLRVRDNGAGIPADLLPRIFDLFVQEDRSLARAHGGLGIGLTLVRSLVELHGGTVEAHSEGLWQGSEFVVRLPLRARPAAGESPLEAEAPEAGGASRVLLVEDNRDAAEAMAELLRLWGHDVQVVHDGGAAVAAARLYRPDVVLLDIGLPGMDGYEVAEALAALPDLPRPRLVAVTGYGQEGDRRRSREAGFDHHLVKPVDLETLRSIVAL